MVHCLGISRRAIFVLGGSFSTKIGRHGFGWKKGLQFRLWVQIRKPQRKLNDTSALKKKRVLIKNGKMNMKKVFGLIIGVVKIKLN
jgi:hypothetical protein